MRYLIFVYVTLFLVAGCYTSYEVTRNNWDGSTYIVDQRSVDSIRQLHKDVGHDVFDWNQYTKERIARLNKNCSATVFKGSKFIGDVELKNGKLMRFCTIPYMYSPSTMVKACKDLSKRYGVTLKFAWIKPDKFKFACTVVSSTEIKGSRALAQGRS